MARFEHKKTEEVIKAKLPRSDAPEVAPITDSVANPVPSDTPCKTPTLVKVLDKFLTSWRSVRIARAGL